MKISKLCEIAVDLGCEVKYNEPLSLHTTFRVGGNCRAFIELASDIAVIELIRAANDMGVRYFVLGNGSNVLFDDRGYNGVIFHIGNLMSKIELHEENNVRASAGAGLNRLCTFALDNSLAGLEFAYGIPGSVGGAVFMNAGAYGGEIKDVIKSVEVVDCKDGKPYIFKVSELDMSYRQTSFMKNGMIVLGGVFELKKGSRAEIKARMDELMSRRKDKQPLEYPSAGSTFKRPEGKFAGKLIQDSGLRGYTVGGAQVSERRSKIGSGGRNCETATSKRSPEAGREQGILI